MSEFRLVPRPQRPSEIHVVASKLDPIFYPDLTPEFAAVIGYVVEIGFTRPRLDDIVVEAGIIMASWSSCEPQPFFTYEYFRRNWLALLDAACLNAEERMEAECCFARRLGRDDIAND